MRFFKRLIRNHGNEPRRIVTDKLRSYGVAHQSFTERGTSIFAKEYFGYFLITIGFLGAPLQLIISAKPAEIGDYLLNCASLARDKTGWRSVVDSNPRYPFDLHAPECS
jgi:hypothetical protein